MGVPQVSSADLGDDPHNGGQEDGQQLPGIRATPCNPTPPQHTHTAPAPTLEHCGEAHTSPAILLPWGLSQQLFVSSDEGGCFKRHCALPGSSHGGLGQEPKVGARLKHDYFLSDPGQGCVQAGALHGPHSPWARAVTRGGPCPPPSPARLLAFSTFISHSPWARAGTTDEGARPEHDGQGLRLGPLPRGGGGAGGGSLREAAHTTRALDPLLLLSSFAGVSPSERPSPGERRRGRGLRR